MAKESGHEDDGFEPPKYLASLIAAVNDGAKAAQGGMLLYLLVGLYLLATAFSSSDEDLLLGKTVTIAQIGAALPVSFSFAIAPLVFVFLHIYTLTRFHMLAANVRHFMRELRATVPLESDRERCRQLLANVEFILALAAPRGSSLHNWAWRWVVRLLLAGFPVAMLLLVQINSLRYQSDTIVWAQRAWLLADLAALVWFFHRNRISERAPRSGRWAAPAQRWAGLLWLPAVLIGLNLVYLNVVPAEAELRLVRYGEVSNEGHAYRSDAISQPLDVVLCPSLRWGCRYLRVERRTLVEHVWDNKAITDLRARQADPVRTLAGLEGVLIRDRSMRFAVLTETRLYAADMVGSDLRKASLSGAEMPAAKLFGARLQGAILDHADLARADLGGAQLMGVNLADAQLANAYLFNAQMADANLSGAELAGADLRHAQLPRANLRGARMAAADLGRAQLAGADLGNAQLAGADLGGAQLAGAVLDSAQLTGADLRRVQLAGADLGGAQVAGANLGGAKLTGANLRFARLTGADLSDAQLAGADLAYTHLTGADLRRAHLAGVNGRNARAWRAISDNHTTIALADFQSMDFATPPDGNEKDSLRKALAEIPDPGRRAAAEQRLRPVLGAPTPGWSLDFAASATRPVLVSNRDDAVFEAHPDWLIDQPTDAYRAAVADLLAGEVANADPKAAARIIRRAVGYLGPALGYPSSTDDRPMGLAIACKLLANADSGQIVLEKSLREVLAGAVKGAAQACPAAASPVGHP